MLCWQSSNETQWPSTLKQNSPLHYQNAYVTFVPCSYLRAFVVHKRTRSYVQKELIRRLWVKRYESDGDFYCTLFAFPCRGVVSKWVQIELFWRLRSNPSFFTSANRSPAHRKSTWNVKYMQVCIVVHGNYDGKCKSKGSATAFFF